jgi:hypothetical protein
LDTGRNGHLSSCGGCLQRIVGSSGTGTFGAFCEPCASGNYDPNEAGWYNNTCNNYAYTEASREVVVS